MKKSSAAGEKFLVRMHFSNGKIEFQPKIFSSRPVGREFKIQINCVLRLKIEKYAIRKRKG